MKRFVLALALVFALSASALAAVTPTISVSGEVTVGFDYVIADDVAYVDEDGNTNPDDDVSTNDGSEFGPTDWVDDETVPAFEGIGHYDWIVDPENPSAPPVWGWVWDEEPYAEYVIPGHYTGYNDPAEADDETEDALGFAWDEKPKVSYDLTVAAKADNYEFSLGAKTDKEAFYLRDAFLKHGAPFIGGTVKAGQDWSKTSSGGDEWKKGVWYDNTFGIVKLAYFLDFDPTKGWKLDATVPFGSDAEVKAAIAKKPSTGLTWKLDATVPFGGAEVVATVNQYPITGLESKSGPYYALKATVPVGKLEAEGYVKYWAADYTFEDEVDNGTPWTDEDDEDYDIPVALGLDKGVSYVKGTVTLNDAGTADEDDDDTTVFGQYWLDKDWELGAATAVAGLELNAKYGTYTDDDFRHRLTFGVPYTKWSLGAGAKVGIFDLDASYSLQNDWAKKSSTSLSASFKQGAVTYTAKYETSRDVNKYSENDTKLNVTAKISF